ncbi:MAG: phosphatase PAP2 family protein [Melioribacteraceae bacterium]|nr:phosphatase PAP2 family protein [Melioribacteraceae bacterium]
MKLYSQIAIIFMLIFQINSYSQENKSIHEKLLDDGIIFLNDAGSYFTYPLRMSGREWLGVGSVTLGTYGLMHLDNKMHDAIGRNTIKTLNDDLWDIPTYYGFIKYANLAAISTYTVGIVSGKDEVRKVGRMLFQSLSYSGITVMFFRTIFGRDRPETNKGSWEFRGLSFNSNLPSFPSGHCTVAFAFSTVLAEYFDTKWSRIFFYGFASLTAYARVLNNQHWFSDVVIGSLVGMSGGMFVINQQNVREKKNKLSITPTFNGLHLSYRLD